jgi:hypothetical protein
MVVDGHEQHDEKSGGQICPLWVEDFSLTQISPD